MSAPRPLYPCALCGGACRGGTSRLDLPATDPLYFEHQARYAPAFDHHAYWREKAGAHPAPPTDPRFWYAVHARPLTWQEARRPDGPPLCSWCHTYPPGYPIGRFTSKTRKAGADE